MPLVLRPRRPARELGLWPKIGNEIGPTRKIGKKKDFPLISYFGLLFSSFPGGAYFRICFVSYFGPKAQNLFSSRPSGSQPWFAHCSCCLKVYSSIQELLEFLLEFRDAISLRVSRTSCYNILSSSAKWWFSLRMIWGFWGPGVRTS